jgi:hypothetical protein
LPAEGEEAPQAQDDYANSELERAVVQKDALKGLQSHPGWSMLAEFIRSQREIRERFIMLTPVNAENMAEMNYQRGEVHMAKLVEAFAAKTIEDAQALIDLVKENRNVD